MAQQYVAADARILRAVAHPTRSALLYELYAREAATATVLSEAVGAPVNAVSFHLRQLEKYGLIEQAPEQGTDARERWWRRSSERGLAFDSEEIGSQPGGEAALEVFKEHSLAWWQAMLSRFFDDADDKPGTVRAINDVPMLLTDDEAQQLATEVQALLLRWSEHGRAQADKGAPDGKGVPAGRRTYIGLSLILPRHRDCPPVERPSLQR